MATKRTRQYFIFKFVPGYTVTSEDMDDMVESGFNLLDGGVIEGDFEIKDASFTEPILRAPDLNRFLFLHHDGNFGTDATKVDFRLGTNNPGVFALEAANQSFSDSIEFSTAENSGKITPIVDYFKVNLQAYSPVPSSSTNATISMLGQNSIREVTTGSQAFTFSNITPGFSGQVLIQNTGAVDCTVTFTNAKTIDGGPFIVRPGVDFTLSYFVWAADNIHVTGAEYE